MPMSKTEKRTAAKKVAESKSQAKKAQRSTSTQTASSSKVIKGKKTLGPAKKK